MVKNKSSASRLYAEIAPSFLIFLESELEGIEQEIERLKESGVESLETKESENVTSTSR